MYLQSQLEGLESIFFELIPMGVELKRHNVQDYYERRFAFATQPMPAVAETELRRQFNTKANQVRNLVDSAESLGAVDNRLNLVRAAATLPDERKQEIDEEIEKLCQSILTEQRIDMDSFNKLTKDTERSAWEFRTLIGSMMFLITDELKSNTGDVPLYLVLQQTIERSESALGRSDPFLIEAKCALAAMKA
jgi:hypothetical protein